MSRFTAGLPRAAFIVAIMAVAASSVEAAAIIDVGTIALEPDQANQLVTLAATGGDAVQGFNLYLMVVNGGTQIEPFGYLPNGTGIRGPAITSVDLVNGTIFEANNAGQVNAFDPEFFPQFISMSVSTASGTVAADGVVARLIFDTTGLFDGSYTVVLAAGGIASELVGATTTLVDGLIVVGETAVVPDGANVAPELDAGPTQLADAGIRVQLNAGAVDPEGGAMTWTWYQRNGPTAVVLDPLSPTPAFDTPSGLVNTDFVFRAVVSDGVNFEFDDVLVTVGADSGMFRANAGPDQSVAPGADVLLNGTVTVPSGQSAVVQWTQLEGPEVSLVGGTTNTPTFVAPAGVVNTFLRFALSASDNTTESIDTIDVEVGANNAAPLADAGLPQYAVSGTQVQLDAGGTDTAGLPVNYFWVQSAGPTVTLSSDSAVAPTFTAPSVSSETVLRFEARVSSGSLLSIDTTDVIVRAGSDDTSNDDTNDGNGNGDDTTPDDNSDQTEVTGTTVPLSSILGQPLAIVAIGLIVLLALFLLWWLWI